MTCLIHLHFNTPLYTMQTPLLFRSNASILNLLMTAAVLLLAQTVQAQISCTNQVTHFGTAQYGCISVSVTHEGSIGSVMECIATSNPVGPYHAGPNGTGSFTFTFSPAVSQVTVDMAGFDNHDGFLEELSFEVNGSHYPITSPGLPPACGLVAQLTPAGNIIGCDECFSSGFNGVNIYGTITTLKITDTWLNLSPIGVVFSLYFCVPPLDAGILTSSDLNLCSNVVATFPPAEEVVLGNGKLLEYILFSDPGDTIGSIVDVNSVPSFAFNPATMQTGVTYYIAAIGGTELNGHVDLNDPCPDFSNAIQVVWRALPTVVFSIANPNVCAGACTTVTATFTGTAPFTLTYSTPVSGSVTQSFSGNTGTFQVCTAADSPPGSFVMQATKVMDSPCICE